MSSENSASSSPHKATSGLMVLTALGVVYGDIGTSPLYALKQVFLPSHNLELNLTNLLGVLSLIFWALIVVITVKYLEFTLRADNHGEGGQLALAAKACLQRGQHRLFGRRLFLMIGLFGAAMLVGDGMVTPAISVISAVEGLTLATPKFGLFVLPITFAILVLLFFLQRFGTAKIGVFFGPIMAVWFAALAILGANSIVQSPEILLAINPMYAVQFFVNNGAIGFFALGAVFFVVTGGEALFADMGHFGREAIRKGWLYFALPALLLNYFGQGALLLRNPEAVTNPFYSMVPTWCLLPFVGLATVATVIASQALITGLFSFASQCIQLGYLPRMVVVHTSDKHMGQIYVPQINWITLVGTLWLVIEFKSSDALASAYGVSVSLSMMISTILVGVVAFEHWGWSLKKSLCIGGFFLAIDISFFGSNLIKIPDGGWVPLFIAFVTYLLMTTWKLGRQVLYERLRKRSYPFSQLIADIKKSPPARVKGTAIFMVGDSDMTPPTLLHNLQHNKVLHETIVFMTIVGREISHVPDDKRVSIEKLSDSIYRVIGYYGFRQEPNVVDLLQRCSQMPNGFKVEEPTFFLGREILVSGKGPELSFWRKALFGFMARNSTSANSYFKLPLDRVIEVGMQIEL